MLHSMENATSLDAARSPVRIRQKDGRCIRSWSAMGTCIPSGRFDHFPPMLARAVAWSMGMTIDVQGSPPEPPFCLVANHLSYMDAVVLMAHIRGVMMAKSEVSSWPLIGTLSRRIGTVFIDRETARDVVRVNTMIASMLESGDGIAFFPEGTTSDGSSVGRFKSSLLNYPAASTYPVHYAAIRYVTRTNEASERVCWWRDMTFATHVYHLVRLG